MARRSDRAERLATLQPRTVRRWLTAPPPRQDSTAADSRTVDGTVLSADISGFTRLAERLAQDGVRQAAEALVAAINRCFDPMIEEVHARGGDVLKFGGDALFVLFQGADHERQAAKAGCTMQQAIGMVDLGLELTLSMTVGVATGPVSLVLAGRARRELIVYGPVVDTCLRLEADAEPGEVLISPATAAALPADWVAAPEPDVLAVADLRNTEVPPPRHPQQPGTPQQSQSDAALTESRWSEVIGPDLADAMDAFDGVGGEIRIVTIGFVMLPTADLDGAQVAAVVERAMELCERYGATMLSTDVASGGIKILLTAGAPVARGGDEDAMLAVVRELVLDPESPPMKAGVNRGLVFAGFLGSKQCRTFTVMGDPTNLAARLLGKADRRSIAVSQPVLDNAHSIYHTEELSPVLVKGRIQPVIVHQLSRFGKTEAKTHSFHPEFVGREDVLAELQSAWDQARHGTGIAVEIRGESGIGTSRLLEQFVGTLPAGLLRFQMSGRLSATGKPYGSVSGFLRAVVGIDAAAGQAEAGEMLRAWVARIDPSASDLLALLAPAVDAVVPETTARVELLEPQFRQEIINGSIASLLGKALIVSTVCVVEDVHWFDRASHGLLRVLATEAETNPWMILASSRPNAEPLAEGAAVKVLTLGPMTEVEIEGLLGAATDLPAGQLAAVVRRAGGNPLFAIELANGLDAEGGLPESIEGLITSRIDRLGHEARGLLRTAAVVGHEFDLDVLSELIGRDPAEELSRMGQLVEVEDNRTGRFRSEIITQVAYGGLSSRRRIELHGAVAARLEERVTDLSQLAWHHGQAGNHLQAWDYNRRAALRAEELGVIDAAADHLEEAINAAAAVGHPAIQDDEVTAGLVDLFGLCVAAKRYERAKVVGEQALERLDGRVERVRLLIRLVKTRAEVDGSYRDEVERLETELAACGTSHDDSEAKAWLQGALAVMHYRLDHLDQALAAADAAIAEAERVGRKQPVPAAMVMRQTVLAGRADPARIPVGEELIRVSSEVGDHRMLLNAHSNLGLDLQEVGRWDEAVDHYVAAIELADRLGDRYRRLLPVIAHAGLLVDRGEWDLARLELDEVRREANHHRSGFATASAQSELGRLEVNSGRPKVGRDLLLLAEDWFLASEVQSNLYEVRLNLAAADVAEGLSNEALALLAELQVPHDLVAQQLGRQRTLAGYATMQRGEPDQALDLLTEAAAETDGHFPYGHALALVGMAEANQFLKRGRAARRLRSEADALLEQLGVVRLPIIPLPK